MKIHFYLIPGILLLYLLLFIMVLTFWNPENIQSKATLSFVGDIMVHYTQIRNAQTGEDQFDFYPHFELIAPYIQEVDLACGNLETTISNSQIGYFGYPNFRSPEALVQALKQSGFDLLTTSNNHSYDGKLFGLTNTLSTIEKYGLRSTGTYASTADWGKPLITTVNDISIAHFAFTNSVNGNEHKIGKEADNHIIRIDKPDFEKRITPFIQEAKENSDFIIAHVHWGSEYHHQPNEMQKKWAQLLANLGIDLIIGSHPHVIQPVEEIKNEKTGQSIPVIWSLGNFIAHQGNDFIANTDIGFLYQATIVKDHKENTIKLEDKKLLPLFIDINKLSEQKYNRVNYSFKVLPLYEEYPLELKQQHSLSNKQNIRYKGAYLFYKEFNLAYNKL